MHKLILYLYHFGEFGRLSQLQWLLALISRRSVRGWQSYKRNKVHNNLVRNQDRRPI